MPCYHPIQGWQSKTINQNGKREIVFQFSNAIKDLPVTVPCGQCIGCRLEYARIWAVRCYHESLMHQDNCFITLTFSDENLNKDYSLVKDDFRLFMRRLRNHFKHKKIRYFHCGEYGEKSLRPHHHACLFGIDFPDKKLISQKQGMNLFQSEILNELWPYGFNTIGDVTFDSACYVAKYITKKIKGKDKEKHYKGRQEEFLTMSRRPGIGHTFLEKYKSDIYPNDYVVIRGVKMKPPKYYQRILKKEELRKLKIKNAPKVYEARYKQDNRKHRLEVREEVKLAQVNLSKERNNQL